MSATMGQITAVATGTKFLCSVPPGATVYISTTATSAAVFLGTKSTVTATTGTPLDPDGPLIMTNPPTASAFDIWAITATGSDAVGFIVIRND